MPYFRFFRTFTEGEEESRRVPYPELDQKNSEPVTLSMGAEETSRYEHAEDSPANDRGEGTLRYRDSNDAVNKAAPFALGQRSLMGEEPHPCQCCDERFLATHTVNAPRSKHADRKRFTCHVCGECSKSFDAFVEHRRLHDQEPPAVAPGSLRFVFKMRCRSKRFVLVKAARH